MKIPILAAVLTIANAVDNSIPVLNKNDIPVFNSNEFIDNSAILPFDSKDPLWKGVSQPLSNMSSIDSFYSKTTAISPIVDKPVGQLPTKPTQPSNETKEVKITEINQTGVDLNSNHNKPENNMPIVLYIRVTPKIVKPTLNIKKNIRVQIIQKKPTQISSPIFHNLPIVTIFKQPIIDEPKWYPQKNIPMPHFYFQQPVQANRNIRSYAQTYFQPAVSYAYRYGY